MKRTHRTLHRYGTLLRAAAVALGLAIVGTGFGVRAEDLTLQGLKALIGRTYPDVPFIADAELARLMQADLALRPRLFDTRSADEYAVSHLLSAVRVDPDAPDLSIAGSDKAAPIVVYCSVGYRSAAIGQKLVRAGYKSVRNLAGGIFGWANGGRPVYRGTRAVREVHPYDAVWGRLLRAELRATVPR